MAAENYVMCLISGMDSLWFHHTILSPQPTIFHPIEDTKILDQLSEYSSKIEVTEQEISSTPQDESSSQESDDLDDEREGEITPFSSPKKSRNMEKSMSCKTLMELEIEEVRGFIDLGFNFRRGNLSNYILNLLPGLQRIDKFDETDDDGEEKKGVMRPYLSEAWIMRRPVSPLLNVKMPEFCCGTDMKKHLKFWAQTVASTVQEY